VAEFAAARSERHVAGSVHNVFAAARNDRMDHECWAGSAKDLTRGECAFGDTRSPATVALLGDSHAEHWLGGLDRAGKTHGWRIESHVMGGCPVADFSGLTSRSAARRYRECNGYRDAAIAHIIAQRPAAVILSNFDSYIDAGDGRLAEYRVSADAWTRGLRRTYARFSNAGIPVIVIRGTPLVPFNVPSCLSRRAAQLPYASDCTFIPDRSFMARAQLAQDVAARGLNVRFVDMNDQVCEARCTTMRGDLVKFTDDNHLTASFSRSLAGALGNRLGEALGGRFTSRARLSVVTN
jgi:hypothetical protein